MILFRRNYSYNQGFFSFSGLIELFFRNIKKILVFFLSILISGYCLIFYEFGGDYFFFHGIIHKPFFVFKFMYNYVKMLFKYRNSLEITIFLKFFFFLLIPYIILRILYYIFQFILFFIHKKTSEKMPIFSSFIAKFINFDKRMQVDPNIIKSMKNMEKFNEMNQREKVILGEDFIAKAEKEEKKSINLRK